MVLVVTLATLTVGCTETVRDLSGAPTNEWVLSMTGVDDLHADGITGSGVRVAVVDTGITASHQEFDGVSVSWRDLVNNREEPYDDNGHGTHVAGLVTAQAVGDAREPFVQGVAPEARLIALKALPGSGTGGADASRDVANAINTAVNLGAHVIVLSLGSQPRLLELDRQVENAVNDAIDAGVVVVAAAGNAEQGEDGSDCEVASPANIPRVIAVAAVDESKEIAAFSCEGNNTSGDGPLGLTERRDPNRKPELSAPGVAVLGPWPNRGCAANAPTGQGYCVVSGTSQATPIVGGIVALLLQENPEYKRQDAEAVEEIKRALISTAEKVGFDHHHQRYGYGIVRADEAIIRLR